MCHARLTGTKRVGSVCTVAGAAQQYEAGAAQQYEVKALKKTTKYIGYFRSLQLGLDGTHRAVGAH